jgi:hypothetical protein
MSALCPVNLVLVWVSGATTEFHPKFSTDALWHLNVYSGIQQLAFVAIM